MTRVQHAANSGTFDNSFKVATCTISTGTCDWQSSKRCIGGAGNFSGKSYDAIGRIYPYDPPISSDFEIDKRYRYSLPSKSVMPA